MRRYPWMFWLANVASLVLFVSTTAEAGYIGLEPERLVGLLELDDASAVAPVLEDAYANAASGDWELAVAAFRNALNTHPKARLGLSVALAQLGRNEEALELVRDEKRSLKLRYAAVLLRLRAEPSVSFKDLRAELLGLTSLGEDVFDLWLALNPGEKELERYASVIASRSGPIVSWRRAEIQLRLQKPEAALQELRDIDGTQQSKWFRNLLDLTRARASFDMGSDEEGESYYWGVLERLEPRTSERLFRDVSSIASSSEWQEYPDLWDTNERKDFFTRFWKGRDPVPTRDDNPRIAEHYRRLARAVRDYPLQSTGRGYFTDEEVFVSMSPRLPYYDSLELFQLQQRSRYWVDHRGIVFLLQGAPDRQIGERTYAGSAKTESWKFTRFRSEPLAFHFVRRPHVREWTLALNLGVASTWPSAPDEPEKVLAYQTRAFGRLYSSRQMFLPLYQRLALERSYRDVRRVLLEESNLMALYIQTAMARDFAGFYTDENILPLSVSISSFYEQGRPSIVVDFAADLTVLDEEKLSPDSELELTVLAYDSEWEEVERHYERRFRLGELASKGAKVFMGRAQIHDLDPADYRMVVQLHQPDTDRYGIAQGHKLLVNLPPGDLGLSDLFLQTGAQNRSELDGDGRTEEPKTPHENILWYPVPHRVIRQSRPSRIVFELYNPEADEDGLAHYEIEERVVTLEKYHGLWSNLARGGIQMAGAFFPLYVAAAEVAKGFIAPEGDQDIVTKRIVEKPAGISILESVETDLSKLDKGVHTVHITIRDLETGQVTSQTITLRVR